MRLLPFSEYALIVEDAMFYKCIRNPDCRDKTGPRPIEVVSLSSKPVPDCLQRIGDFTSDPAWRAQRVSDITEIYGTTFGKLMGYTG